MRIDVKNVLLKTAFISAAAALTFGCGEKAKESDEEKAQPVDTWVVESSESDSVARFRYLSTSKNAKYKCMIEKDGQTGSWQDCPAGGFDAPVENGVRYTFKVKAIVNGVEDTEPYSYTFVGGGGKVSSTGYTTQILGKDRIGSVVNTDLLTVQFAIENRDIPTKQIRYECMREREMQFSPCPSSDLYTFSGLLDGNEYSLSVRAVNSLDGSIGSVDKLSFRVDLSGNGAPGTDPANPGGNQGNQTDDPGISEFLVGSFYKFNIPSSMHVTEYSTSKTYNNSLSYFRVMVDSDPYYIGNYACNMIFDRQVSSNTPAGETLNYCHSTPTDNLFKRLSDYRIARNHIEVATDSRQVETDEYSHERIMINVFDADYEFMNARSRFEMLCMNRRGSIKKTPPIVLAQDFWLFSKLRAEFWMCDVDLSGTGPGLPGSEEWRVGAFMIVDDGATHPDMLCETDCNYSNSSLLEVLYMARPNETNWRPENFARTAQEKLFPNLMRIQP